MLSAGFTGIELAGLIIPAVTGLANLGVQAATGGAPEPAKPNLPAQQIQQPQLPSMRSGMMGQRMMTPQSRQSTALAMLR